MLDHSSNYPIFFTFPIVSYICYIWYQHIIDTEYWSYLDTVNFFIHEFGHLFFAIFGNKLIEIMGGTIMQLLIPMVLMCMFFVQKDRFAVALCGAWIGIHLFYISRYAGDAQDQLLPLIGMGWGDYVIHDWNYIFSYFGVLSSTDSISAIFFILGNISLGGFLLYACILIYNRFKNPL